MAEPITIDLPEIESRPRQTNPLAEEERAFAKLFPSLLQTHLGQFVAIHGGQVIAFGTNRIETAKQAYTRVGYVPVLVRLVSESPPVPVQMPSVWLSPLT